MRPASVEDYRELARRRLPRMFFDYIDGGSFADSTLRANVSDLAAVKLRQRVLIDTTERQTGIRLFGQPMSMPLGLAPVGVAGLYARRGEAQAARAAKVAGVPLCLSTLSICTIEEVAAAGQAPWFQLYMLKDRGYMRELLRRAASAECPVLLFTVDMPVSGGRYRDYRRSGIIGAGGVDRLIQGVSRPRWVWDVLCRGQPAVPGNIAPALPQDDVSIGACLTWVGTNMDRSVTWSDLDFVRENWNGPLVIKGVLDPADAREAARLGAEGIVVSNHGGRQLDGVRSSISALPPIVDAVGGQVELLLDGGIRSGLDILRACALGASACLIGRPWAWALAAGGEAMVERWLGTLRAELDVAMALSGCIDIANASRDLIDADPASLAELLAVGSVAK